MPPENMSNCQQQCGCKASRDVAPEAGTVELAGQASTSSLFAIPKMDCPSEERLIRMALSDADGVAALDFDLGKRELRIGHTGAVDPITQRLEKLGLGARLISSTAMQDAIPDAGSKLPTPAEEATVLTWLLGINALMFAVEILGGWLAQSTGLIADSLDMFADAAVYGVALYAVHRQAGQQRKAARLSGWLQLLLAMGALSEVARRMAFGSEPEPPLMMGTALLALAANVTCMLLLARHRHGGMHMKASWIFSTNDVLANLGVIIAGALVAWSGSNYPDLLIGTLIALLVINGARRILALRG